MSGLFSFVFGGWWEISKIRKPGGAPLNPMMVGRVNPCAPSWLANESIRFLSTHCRERNAGLFPRIIIPVVAFSLPDARQTALQRSRLARSAGPTLWFMGFRFPPRRAVALEGSWCILAGTLKLPR